jgi:hypothetical protein
LALTELVKQGNTSWLGKLEGAVAVIENDTCHFSVTGDAAIFLYRNQEATLISEGLADKDAATHPLKTFLEISSGKLLPGDTLLVSSPELFSLCSEELLLKNVSRMEGLAFARFVRTALVNELDLASSIIITIYEQEKPKSEPRRASLLEEASKINLQNVFSNSSFSSPLKSKNLGHKDSQDDAELQLNDGSEFSQTSSDYTDEKTGHIYVQGDTPEPNYQEPTRLRLALTEAWAAFTFTVHKNAKRWSKKSKRAALAGAEEFGNKASSLGVKSVHLTKKTSSQFVATSMAFMRSQKRRLKKKLARYQAARAIKKQTATLQSLNLTRIPQVTSSIFKETHITPQILPIQTDSSISPLEIPLSTIPFSQKIILIKLSSLL